MGRLATIYGGSGFVGRYIAAELAERGWRVRVAVRRPNQALFVRTYGVPGQVEPVFCNIRDDRSVALAAHRADAVINCVGTFDWRGRNDFEAVQNEGAGRVARAAAAEGATQMVHVSALGVERDHDSLYAASKRAGEAAVLAAMPSATILRPSVIFGVEDGFFNRFAAMSRLGPVLPIFGGKTRFQPAYVVDVARAAVMGAEGAAEGVYELGGPEIRTLREWVEVILRVVHRRRLIVDLPIWAGRLMAFALDMVEAGTLGLVHNGLLTRDQLKQLRHDNVVAPGARDFDTLGITPLAPEAVIDTYLWRYRPTGQFDAIRESAKKLRAR